MMAVVKVVSVNNSATPDLTSHIHEDLGTPTGRTLHLPGNQALENLAAPYLVPGREL
jgi:hypothetical protein